MKKIRKCVIPAAWFGTRFLPATKALPKEMFPIIDKPIMQLLVEEAISAGCTDIIIVTWRSKRAIEDHFDSNFELEERLDKSWKFDYLKTVKWLNDMANIVYVRQPYPRWDWDAILRTKNLIWDEPFLVLFGDDLVDNKKSAASQLVDAYKEKKAPVVATIKVKDSEVSLYWIYESKKDDKDIFKVSNVIEKPLKSETDSRSGSIWKYILTPDIFKYLEKLEWWSAKSELRLANALWEMAKKSSIYWVDIKWNRYDAGDKLWYLKAIVSYALKRDDLKWEFTEFLKWLKL